MKLEPGTFCPLIGEDCMGIKCSWFTQLRGTSGNTGKDIDEWACAVAWVPVLLIENAQQSRQAGAAIESFRNQVAEANRASQAALMESARNIRQIPYREALP